VYTVREHPGQATARSHPFEEGMTMKTRSSRRYAFTSVQALVIATQLLVPTLALAKLERVGPMLTNGYGYPAWYQDTTGVALEFCAPQNQSEVDGGWCLLLPGDPPAIPEVFPNQFFDEHFYWAGDSILAVPSGPSGKANNQARLILALEGAFSVGPPVPGEQIVFARLRLNIRELPYDGTYTVYHPFGTWVFNNQVAGDRLFWTEDVGLQCAVGDFSCALVGGVGPFLLPSVTPGGAELPPIPDLKPGDDPFTDAAGFTAYPAPYPGAKYIADPARVGPVTGSPIDQNYFRIVGPNGLDLTTNDFTLMGRVYTGQMPGRVEVDRATYSSAEPAKVDVYASAFPTTQGRIPGSPRPAAVQPVLGFYTAPCVVDPVTGAYGEPAGLTAIPMSNQGSRFWGQYQSGTTALPPREYCVEDYTARNAAGQVVGAFFPAKVTDLVTISKAEYDPATGQLTVAATSSNTNPLDPATLTLDGELPLVGGEIVTATAAPPSKARVVSSWGGITDLAVTALAGTVGAASTVPVAANFSIDGIEDTDLLIPSVLTQPGSSLGGGPIPAGAVVTITTLPRIGTHTLNADGSILYTPNANVSGVEGIGYTITYPAGSTSTSSQAYITINIAPVNDAPVANADTFNAILNQAITVNVFANDSDPDGAADLADAIIVTGNASLGLAAGTTVPGGAIAFTPTATGPQTFTYQVRDAGGGTGTSLTSNTVSVTVNVTGSETLAFSGQSQYVVSKGRLRGSGTISPAAGQTIKIYWAENSTPPTPIGGAVGTVVSAGGTWAFDWLNVARPNTSQGTAATRIMAVSSNNTTIAQTVQLK
jgi:hypothetical protein